LPINWFSLVVGHSELTILPMQPEDIPDILELEAETLSAWSRKQLEDELEQPTGFQFVVRREGSEKIQAVLCVRIIADEAEILKLSVAEYARKKGLGDQLLDFVLRFYGEKGVKNCFLELRASNAAARSLYEKKGFFMVGSRKDYYEEPVEDAILMRLELEFPSKNEIMK
jgi:ribosomal-protein-alanine N-acetyltransferase